MEVIKEGMKAFRKELATNEGRNDARKGGRKLGTNEVSKQRRVGGINEGMNGGTKEGWN